jgi:hypothetical protein
LRLVACRGACTFREKLSSENRKERCNLADQRVDMKVILKWILRCSLKDLDFVQLSQDRISIGLLCIW